VFKNQMDLHLLLINCAKNGGAIDLGFNGEGA
jgi:hypothetical protein